MKPEAALAAAEEAVAIMEARGLKALAYSAPIALRRFFSLARASPPASGSRPSSDERWTSRARAARESSSLRSTASWRRSRGCGGEESTAASEEAEAERIVAEINSGSARRHARSAEELLLDNNYAATLVVGGREREGLELYRAVSREASASGDAGVALTLATGEALTNWITGTLPDGLEAARRALDLAGDDERVGSGLAFTCPLALAHALCGACAGGMGELERAYGDFERGIALARKHDDLEMESYALAIRSTHLINLGDFDPAREDAERALECAERVQTPYAIAIAEGAIALAYAGAGHWEVALRQAEQLLTKLREHDLALFEEPPLLATIARSRLALGDQEGARAAAEEGVEIMEARGLRAAALPAPIALAEVLVATEADAASERIEAVLGRAMEVASESGARIFEPQIHSELAAVAALRGDEVTAELEQASAGRILTDLDAPHDPPAPAN